MDGSVYLYLSSDIQQKFQGKPPKIFGLCECHPSIDTGFNIVKMLMQIG